MKGKRTPDFYDRALRRILWLGAGIGAAGTIAALTVRGPKNGAGFLVGALLSMLAFNSLRRMAEGLGSSGNRRLAGSVLFYMLRYAIIGAVIYGIVRTLETSLIWVLAGLLVSAAAIFAEMFYELVFL
ncbi:MAG: ATP synthase subunit I [Bryobacteraceae bacterium]